MFQHRLKRQKGVGSRRELLRYKHILNKGKRRALATNFALYKPKVPQILLKHAVGALI